MSGLFTFIIFNEIDIYAYDYVSSINCDLQNIEGKESSDYDRSNGGDGSLNEDWYDIGVSLPHPVDYSGSDLLTFLKPGDLIYEDQGGWGITHHSAIVEGVFYDITYSQYYVRILESGLEGGVTRGLMTPTRFEEKEVSIYRLTDASSTQISAAISFFISQLGKPYAISTTKNANPDNPNWYCSELVWASYYWQGIYLDDNDNSPVWPAEIRDYNNATLIMDYRYSTTISNTTSTNHTILCNGEYFVESHNLIFVNNCLKRCSVCEREIYTHNYTYTWQNYMRHNATCSCGDSHLEMHITNGLPISPGSPYSQCLLCGGLALVTINSPGNSMNNFLLNIDYKQLYIPLKAKEKKEGRFNE